MAGSELSVDVVDATSNLGLSPPEEGREPGVRGLASALRQQGPLSRLGAEDGGGPTPPAYSSRSPASTGPRNGEAIREFSVDLAERVGTVVESGCFPLVLGGDCSISSGVCSRLGRLVGSVWFPWTAISTSGIPATPYASAPLPAKTLPR